MQRFSARQCKRARALLKWNVNDLSSRTRLKPRRIEELERGAVRLTQPEIIELISVFEKNGIVFKGEEDVSLRKSSGAMGDSTGKTHAGGGGGSAETVRVDVTDEVMQQALDERSPDEIRSERERKRTGDSF